MVNAGLWVRLANYKRSEHKETRNHFGASTGTKIENMTEVRLPSDWVQFLNVRDFLVWVEDQGINPDDWDVKTEDASLDMILSFSRDEYATLFKLRFGYGALH